MYRNITNAPYNSIQHELVIDGSPVLTKTTIGPTVIHSSLKRVGTLDYLDVAGDVEVSGKINSVTPEMFQQISKMGNTMLTSDSWWSISNLDQQLSMTSSPTFNSLQLNGDLTVQGDLRVEGSKVIIDAETIVSSDNIFILNSTPYSVSDAGYTVKRDHGDIVNTDQPAEEGIVVNSTNTTITLSNEANDIDGYYNNWLIVIGIEMKEIKSYDGASRTATIDTVDD